MTLTDVIEFLEENGPDASTALTARKVMDRGVPLESEIGKPGVFFELERHQAVLGDRYISGLGMNAFVTRWEKYYFDGKEITCVGETRPRAFDPTQVDYSRVAESITDDLWFNFEEREDSSFEATESTNCSTSIVSSLDEAEEFGRKIAGEWDLNSCLIEGEDLLSANEYQEILKRLKDAAMESAGEKARDALAEEMLKLGPG